MGSIRQNIICNSKHGMSYLFSLRNLETLLLLKLLWTIQDYRILHSLNIEKLIAITALAIKSAKLWFSKSYLLIQFRMFGSV